MLKHKWFGEHWVAAPIVVTVWRGSNIESGLEVDKIHIDMKDGQSGKQWKHAKEIIGLGLEMAAFFNMMHFVPSCTLNLEIFDVVLL